ncbi:MAG TPA: phosphoadenylyl-sulfate reductase, partial [Chitinophagaceae bacterium]|nr:phosphoadenylyl-sulfate reductase [Chitinophagaceae bacterium]
MKESPLKLVAELLEDTQYLDPQASLAWIAKSFPGKTVFSSSLGLEDQLITHLIWENDIPVDIFTLDTGRLFPETYSLMERLYGRYGKRIRVCFPNAGKVQQLVNEKGPNCFYESVENRKACCGIRKVDPLGIALEGMDCWITGIRASQSGLRAATPGVEWDGTHGVVKFHPLLHWSLERVMAFITDHQIPYNPLHDRGFVSIGCAPCTRALKPGEDERAGRWWWE